MSTEAGPPPQFEGMVVASKAGPPEFLDLRRPGGKVRFAFGEPGFRSSVWTVRVTPAAGEIYVFERSLSREMKISLHSSGVWRHAFMPGPDGQLTLSGLRWADRRGDRLIDRWRRPEPVAEHYTFGLRIRVHASEVRSVPDDDATEDRVRFVEQPDPGRVGQFTIMLARPNADGFQLTDSVVVAAFSTKRDETVLVIATMCDPSERERATIEAARRFAVNRGSDGETGVAGRALLHLERGDDGGRTVWEIAVD